MTDRTTADQLPVDELIRLNARLKAELESLGVYQARMEDSVARLATLCAAAACLSSGVQRGEVPGAIAEILANLVGCKHIAIFELDARDAVLKPTAVPGIDHGRNTSIVMGEGLIGKAAATSTVYVAQQENEVRPLPGTNDQEENLTACIPLQISGRVIGAIALFGMLPQKPAFEPVDRELFGLLGPLAAAALLTSWHNPPASRSS